MSYKNGKDVLPPNLLKQLQEYIQGEIVYIPKKEQKRAGWGENNGTRIIIERRNREIFRLYQTGSSVMELIKVFHLSEDSIRKIIVKTRELTANQA
ncbi:CD3324 family protein [Paenibacillus roseipurpureus]|uniref:CD3324 family protein n=1 Tax=Paenibacillus roseopurpureus TaxID=2918901 RepID=A0AA96RJX3_9BACL|nr:CD3324 family protein [Paenibacillus sp. MBLB1832]WNR43626.1 CD3324 family protein [Paenibacillus sp. MBLB1832]